MAKQNKTLLRELIQFVVFEDTDLLRRFLLENNEIAKRAGEYLLEREKLLSEIRDLRAQVANLEFDLKKAHETLGQYIGDEAKEAGLAVAEPKRFKVGDSIQDEDYALVPVGTRIEEDLLYKTGENEWTDEEYGATYPNYDLYSARRITHLPDSYVNGI